MDAASHRQPKTLAPLAWIAVWGPGLLVMLADTDAGNVVTGGSGGRAMGLSAAAAAAAARSRCSTWCRN